MVWLDRSIPAENKPWLESQNHRRQERKTRGSVTFARVLLDQLSMRKNPHFTPSIQTETRGPLRTVLFFFFKTTQSYSPRSKFSTCLLCHHQCPGSCGCSFRSVVTGYDPTTASACLMIKPFIPP